MPRGAELSHGLLRAGELVVDVTGARVVVLHGDLAQVGNAVALFVAQLFGRAVLLRARARLNRARHRLLMQLLLLPQLSFHRARARTLRLGRVSDEPRNLGLVLLLLQRIVWRQFRTRVDIVHVFEADIGAARR